MRILPQDQPDVSTLISRYFVGKEQVFAQVLTVENLEWEAGLLEEAESILPENVLFNLHFDMIVNGGREAISEYYRGLARGKNSILEQVREHLVPADIQKLDEAITQLFDKIKEKSAALLEQMDPAQAINQMTSQMAGAALDSAKSGLFSVVKGLWNSLTEGGTTIGTLQFVLDLIGFIGDFIFSVTGIPVGSIADLINAAIYVVRALLPNPAPGMWTLAMISLISAIPIYGDIAKGFKGAARFAEPVIQASATGASAAAAAMRRIPANQQPGVLRFLRFIARNGAKVIATAVSMLGKAFGAIVSKVAGILPFIGTPLKSFFEGIGAKLVKFGDSVKQFSTRWDSIDAALKVNLKAADAVLSKIHKGGGSLEYVAKTDTIKAIGADGKLIDEFPANLLINSKKWKKAMPEYLSPGKEAVQATRYENFISNGGLSIKNALTRSLKGLFNFSAKTLSLIGKVIVRLGSGSSEEPLSLGYTEPELETIGAVNFNEWIEDEIKKKQEETGAIYVPYVTLSSEDEATKDKIKDYNNDVAQKLGERKIIDVVRKETAGDKAADEFNRFYDDVLSGKIIQLEDGTYVKKEETSKEEKEEPQEETVTKRSKFNVERARKALEN
jgi:hypothetical protein